MPPLRNIGFGRIEKIKLETNVNFTIQTRTDAKRFANARFEPCACLRHHPRRRERLNWLAEREHSQVIAGFL
jgi:hypothetical protein